MCVAQTTTPWSLILDRDLDRYLQSHGSGDVGEDTEARVLRFMDGVASCFGEGHVMVFMVHMKE